MVRKRTIVAIGELMQIESRGELRVGGIAADAAVAGAGLGQKAVAISRVGQDKLADDLIGELRQRGVEIGHVQHDPDHPTARLVIRSIMSKLTFQLDVDTAFDHLQWDYDLDDVAQTTDLVFYGALARRSGLTRSTIERFLGECHSALRVFDLTNRIEVDSLNDINAPSAFNYADLVIADSEGLAAVSPAARSGEPLDGLAGLLKQHNVTAGLLYDPGGGTTLVAGSDRVHHETDYEGEERTAASVAVSLALLLGMDGSEVFDLADRYVAHRAKSPGEAMSIV